MNDSVILVVADDKYLRHAKALMTGCVVQGGWQGDFCLMCPDDCDTSEIEGRGPDVHKVPKGASVNAVKFHIFSTYFHRWRRLLYLDCDVLIQGDLNVFFDELEDQFPAILCDSSNDSSILDDWIHFDPASDKDDLGLPDTYDHLRERFPHVDDRILTSDVMYFCPAVIPSGTPEKLAKIQEEFKENNPGGYDQQVINLLLYNRMRPITKRHCTWFAFDDPGNRVVCEKRGWTGDEEPIILHYWGMYAPWLDKTSDAGAFFNHRLNRPCREVYLENLASFDTIFPVT